MASGPSTHPTPSEDPALRAAVEAPLDDEPVTEEEERLVEEAREQIRRGEVLTTGELLRDLGL